MNILGISAFYHDSAASIIKNGKIIAAAQEERFTRKKHDHDFPVNAIEYCLQEADITPGQVDYIAFYDKPFLKFERILETYLQYAPRGLMSFTKALPLWLKKKLWIKTLIEDEFKDFEGKILFSEHHISHAAAAFFPSPFNDAAIITTDGVGEWTTTSMGLGEANRVTLLREIHFPHSLGLLYSAFTYYTGFKVNSGEYKVMGLAPYGEPRYADRILEHLIDLKEDGSFRLNMTYFNYPAGLTMTSNAFNQLFGGPPRKPESQLRQKDMDMAASIQKVIELTMIKMATHVKKITGKKRLVLAGGVALNCVANGLVLKKNLFEDIWIQPASGDAGGALGAALALWYQYLENPRQSDNSSDAQHGSFLGPSFSNRYIEDYIGTHRLPAKKLDGDELYATVSELLSQEQVVGWFQGRMEFGPRALGARSILGDARSPEMQKKMNLKIKFRESFRPFAPAIIAEEVSNYFDIDRPSPYMLLVAGVKKKLQHEMSAAEKNLFGIEKLNIVRSSIPAVTHIDYSARLQTVHRETNPGFYKLLQHFKVRTGCPVLVNTSFNVRGEPIVCTPDDAYRCFMSTEMDYLVMGHYLFDKNEQPAENKKHISIQNMELD
jgi:carbamoyltransferase